MLRNLFTRFARDERGVTLVEYGIGVSLAIIVGVVLLQTLGGAINTNLEGAANIMGEACTVADQAAADADANINVGDIVCG